MDKKTLNLLLGIAIGFFLAFTSASLLKKDITKETLAHASRLIGLEFTESEKDSMITELEDFRESYGEIRNLKIGNEVPPALNFNPIPVGKKFDNAQQTLEWDIPTNISLPDNRSELAFYTVAELSSLIKNRKISVVELTNFFLERLKTYGDTLEAVVTLTEKRALQQAKKLDQEIANGKYRGPLHGIPYGLKDLFALEDYKTTWGAEPYKNQQIEQTATVVEKLDEAGAVLVAKTTLGALAYGDVWFGGKTRNPWNLEQGSSGSSAGSAATTSAGLVPFAIGTETWGSIVSPSTRTGTTGLRPTFGRVSRHGAMALSWSMDKVGPLTRSVEDAAIVFNAIYGPDGKDQSVVDLPFNYDQELNLGDLTVGYLESAFKSEYSNRSRDSLTLATLRSKGVNLKPIELPEFPTSSLSFILFAEAATAFDQLTRLNQDDQMVRQGKEAWPNLFRASRFIPAVEYIQANRARWQLIQKMDSLMQQVDLYISPTFGADNLLLTNLTGHPSVVLPNGFTDEGQPTSITFIGDLYDEGTLLEFAKLYQQATEHHKRHPKLFMDQ
ncbi:amidase [Aliifodinibius sp. S!AR15-10]|uniref:amidase n=1 Tax=Aliifodinibius sp. S!AR15-10 TaxID=2950437 RepID=UPI0028605A33|nr:amidase [Aliifodinibius sp. S!AR15-10]MDR8391805.1 amidase [Aliifodinibius sp. S!AR15-10]